MSEDGPQAEAATRAVVVEREMPFPPERVWRALATPHLVAEWLMTPEGYAPEAGCRFALKGDWGGVACEVLAVEPGRVMRWRWDHPHADAAFDLRSTVTFTLTPTASGTRLRVEQAGFRPAQGQAFGGARLGWARHLEAFEAALVRLG